MDIKRNETKKKGGGKKKVGKNYRGCQVFLIKEKKKWGLGGNGLPPQKKVGGGCWQSSWKKNTQKFLKGAREASSIG